jgi:hypothetical protein
LFPVVSRFESWVGWSGVQGGLSLAGQGDGFVWGTEIAGQDAVEFVADTDTLLTMCACSASSDQPY